MNNNQKRTLDFIREYIEQHGYSPSYEEIRDGLDQKSKSEVHRSINNLERLGHITRVKGQARSIELPDYRPLDCLTEQQLRFEAAKRGYRLVSISFDE